MSATERTLTELPGTLTEPSTAGAVARMRSKSVQPRLGSVSVRHNRRADMREFALLVRDLRHMSARAASDLSDWLVHLALISVIRERGGQVTVP